MLWERYKKKFIEKLMMCTLDLSCEQLIKSSIYVSITCHQREPHNHSYS